MRFFHCSSSGFGRGFVVLVHSRVISLHSSVGRGRFLKLGGVDWM